MLYFFIFPKKKSSIFPESEKTHVQKRTSALIRVRLSVKIFWRKKILFFYVFLKKE